MGLSQSSIAIVDDDIISLKMLDHALSKLSHYRTILIQEATQALSLFLVNPPDLIILDLVMPELDGLQLCRQIRATPVLADIPVLFLSARNDTKDVVKGFQAGGNDYVTKPFVLEELLARVECQLRLRSSERERNEMQRHLLLSARLGALATLTEGVNHEINNPLAIVLGSLEHLESTDLDKDGRLAIYERMRRASNRIAQIVASLRRFNGSAPERVECIDMAEVVSQTVGLLRGVYSSRGIQMDFEKPSHACLVMGCFEDLQLVLSNLCANALDALLECGGGVLSIRVFHEGPKVFLQIRDSGPGIPEQILPRIFDPFFTTKPPGKGVGLGLTIAHSIVSKMGGAIDICSIRHKGTLCEVRLPFAGGNQ